LERKKALIKLTIRGDIKMGFFDGVKTGLETGADAMTFGSYNKFMKPALGGIGDTLAGKPAPVQKYHLPEEARQAFLQSPEQKQFLDYLSNKTYNPQQGPSQAEALLAQKMDETRAATAGAMASARGVYNPALLAREAAKIQADTSQQAAQGGAILRAQEEAQRQDFQNKREMQFLAAIEQERERKVDYERLRAGVEAGNVDALNKAEEMARERQRQFLSGLGQAGATVAAG
jgi:hypothetical protein